MLLLLSRFSRIDSLQPHRPQPTRLPSPWDSPGKNTGVGCHFVLQCMKVKSESEVAQLCLTLNDPMDYSPPGSFIHGMFQATVLAWGAIAFSALYASSFRILIVIFSILKSFASPPIFCFHTMMHTCLLTLKLVYSNFPPVL